MENPVLNDHLSCLFLVLVSCLISQHLFFSKWALTNSPLSPNCYIASWCSCRPRAWWCELHSLVDWCIQMGGACPYWIFSLLGFWFWRWQGCCWHVQWRWSCKAVTKKQWCSTAATTTRILTRARACANKGGGFQIPDSRRAASGNGKLIRDQPQYS